MAEGGWWWGGASSGGSTSSGGGTTPPPSSFCHKITYDNMPKTPDYAPPYSVLTTTHELFVKIFCPSTGHPTATVGVGNPLHYIYQYGYTLQNNTWRKVTLTGTELFGNAWYQGTATTILPQTHTDLATDQYFLSYLCAWTGSQWKCGCSDRTCATPHWNLQVFGR